jgi:hypothetical protein
MAARMKGKRLGDVVRRGVPSGGIGEGGRESQLGSITGEAYVRLAREPNSVFPV